MEKTFAVIETGGKQYTIREGDVISLEKMDGEFASGDVVTFDKVLLREREGKTEVGTPFVVGATVTAEFQEEGKGIKILGFRFRSKSNWKRRFGHRQPFTKVKITKIN